MAIVISKLNLFSTFEISGSAGHWFLPSSVMIYAQTGPAMSEDNTHADNQIEIDGRAISSDADGFSSSGASTDVFVGAQGAIAGDSSGITTSGANQSITNSGTIDSGQTGILSKGESLLVDNRGSIGGSVGVSFGDFGGDIVNGATGIISGEHTIETTTTELETVKTINNGKLIGTLAYDATGAGRDIILNRGLIQGDILLGAGDDTFDTVGGKFRDEVHGGIGSDTYIVNRKTTTIIEEIADAGTDTVKSVGSYTLGAGLENLLLLGLNNHTGTGNGLANLLTGNTGQNSLHGKGGSDTLNGGSGADTMTGGNGADLFIFKTGDGHDTVTDFNGKLDSMDLSGMRGIESFSDLKQNHIEISDGAITIVDGTDQIVLQDVVKSDLTRGHFDF